MAERCGNASKAAFAGRSTRRRVAPLALISGLLLLAACAHGSPGSLEYDGKSADAIGHSSDGKSSKGGAIGVNSYLWRASLDTISFMPLASADPYGGTIITDWYANPNSPNERFKITVYILDQQLRSDALKVSVFRQAKGTGGAWLDAPADPRTGTKLENSILTRAREMRITSVDK